MALYIYHERTKRLIPLSDRVFLVNDAYCDEETIAELLDGIDFIEESQHKGYRLDEYNMGNLFYGGE